MKINEIINNTNFYQDLDKVIETSEVRLSCFGKRLVTIQDYEGTIPLDELTKKWIHLDSKKNYSFEECHAAVALQSRLLRHYQTSDKLIDNSNNLFVIICRVIRTSISYFFHYLGIPSSILFHSNERQTLAWAPEKIHMQVLHQADKLGLYRTG